MQNLVKCGQALHERQAVMATHPQRGCCSCGLRYISGLLQLALVANGPHARRTFWPAAECVIVLDMRQHACVLCLSIDVPECPAGLRVFPGHGRRLVRQTRQMGCRPSTRITTPDVVQTRENHVGHCQSTPRLSEKAETATLPSDGFYPLEI